MTYGQKDVRYLYGKWYFDLCSNYLRLVEEGNKTILGYKFIKLHIL